MKVKGVQVSNGAKIRNRYNQVPHLTQDTNIYVLSIKASTIQVYNCGNPRTRQCGGRPSFQVVRHLSRTCIYVVLYIYYVLLLLFYIMYRKKKSFLFLPKGRAFVTMQNRWNNRISDGGVYAQIRKGLGMHLVTYLNHDTVPFLLIVLYFGRNQ